MQLERSCARYQRIIFQAHHDPTLLVNSKRTSMSSFRFCATMDVWGGVCVDADGGKQ